jgi:hypothetical protein
MPAYRSEALIDALRRADAGAISAVLADSVTFNSPVATYTDRADVAHLLVTIGRVLDGLELAGEFHEGDRTVALVAAAVGEHRLDGALVQTAAADGRLAELTLLLRPLAGLVAAVERMGEALRVRPLPSDRR